MGSHAPTQCSSRVGTRGFDRATNQLGQVLGIGLASDQRLQDGAAAHAQDVGEDTGELEVRMLEGLLDPEDMLRDLPHELLAGAGEIAQLLDRFRGHKAAADEPWAKRSAIQVASLTSLWRPGMWRMCIALARTNSPLPSSTCHTGLQVPAPRFHRDVGAAVGAEPVAQGQKLRRRRAEGPHVVRDGQARRDARTGNDRMLMNVETGALGMDDVHDDLLAGVASAWSPQWSKSRGRALRRLVDRTVRGARGARVQLLNGLCAPMTGRPRCQHVPRHYRISCAAVPRGRVGNCSENHMSTGAALMLRVQASRGSPGLSAAESHDG
jgi:hypothetical protein